MCRYRLLHKEKMPMGEIEKQVTFEAGAIEEAG